MTVKLSYQKELAREIKQTPPEYLPALLQIVRLYRESVTLKPAADSFRQGWTEAIQGDTVPVSELWKDLDVSAKPATRTS